MTIKQYIYIKNSSSLKMNRSETLNIIAAIIVMFAIVSVEFIIKNQIQFLTIAAIFSVILILGNVVSKKIIADSLDASVEHEIWSISRYWFKPHHHLERKIPIGIIIPLFFTIYSLGLIKMPPFLTYETRAKKYRAAKRFGYYSYTQMTDFHNGLIGAAGVIFSLLLAIILYALPFDLEKFAALSVLYAFFNMIPIGKLDGAQIFFGSKTLYTTISIITLIFMIYSILLLIS
jgi:hypothetical protein